MATTFRFFPYLHEDKMATVAAKKLQAKLAEQIFKETHFSRTEVEKLLEMFRSLVPPHQKCKMDRTKFRTVLHNTFQMTDDIQMDRVFKAFDADNDGAISMKEWIFGLSIFLRGTLQEKIEYCFAVYDLNGDGFIQREEMFHMLKTCLIKQPTEEDPDEGVRDLVETLLKLMDQDKDGRLGYEDYKKSVEQDDLLLESFGQCLPDDKYVDDFEKQFAD
eukprot:Seg136.1 transcript_id=Seg136.1/GoldUCD/mRNA.D3Y31 product="EF-hand calcium-binding domain-containing protein 1" protein_id=Seg136.1/GoldUCD/D3Y31